MPSGGAHGIRVRVGVIVIDEANQDVQATLALLKAEGIEDVGVDRVRGIGRGSGIRAKEPSVEQLCGNCWRGKLCITSDGSAYPCVFSRFVTVGDVHDSLASIISGSLLRDFRITQSRRPTSKHSAKCRPDVCAPEECNPGECYPDNVPCKPVFDQKIAAVHGIEVDLSLLGRRGYPSGVPS